MDTEILVRGRGGAVGGKEGELKILNELKNVCCRRKELRWTGACGLAVLCGWLTLICNVAVVVVIGSKVRITKNVTCFFLRLDTREHKLSLSRFIFV